MGQYWFAIVRGVDSQFDTSYQGLSNVTL